jgi:Capsule assembly protein Wzi
VPAVTGAQASPTVPPDARVYADISWLASSGLIPDLIIGQRPFSRREVVRLLREARANVSSLRADSRPWATLVIDSDLRRYEQEGLRPADWIAASGTFLDSPFRRIPADPNGAIDATINPLVAYERGRPIADGGTLALQSQHSATLGSHVAVAVSPRATVQDGRGVVPGDGLRLQSGTVNALFGNAVLEAGRDYAVFGQAPTGGILLSTNAPAFDLVRIFNDHPARLPWVFGRLGPMRGTLFASDLGRAQNHPHAKLVGYKVSALVRPNVEIGVQVIDETGGNGAPPANFRDRFIDIFPLADIVFNPGSDFLFSNKLAGVDFHLRIPRAYGFELYGEGAVDDFDGRRLKSSLLEDGGYLAGISLSCLPRCGALLVRAEYHQTGIRYYTHAQFTTGIAHNGFILGDALGPRGVGGYLTVEGQDGRLGSLAVAGGYEVRSGNKYGSTSSSPNDADFHFVQVEHHPGERRARAIATWTSPDRQRCITLAASIGLERVVNFEFIDGRRRTNALVQLGVEVRP